MACAGCFRHSDSWMRVDTRAMLLLALVLVTPAQADSPEVPARDSLTPVFLEAAGARIGEIIIENENIFDPADPRENNLLFRAANRLHIRTLPRVIRRQLLFRSGDVYSQRLVDESERILRGNKYLENARIEPEHYADGKVDVHVYTKDVWTLTPRIDFGRNGGENTGSFGFVESNLFGTGVSLSLLHESEVDRDTDRIEYQDRELGNTRYALLAAYTGSNEGNGYEFDLGLPFYALDRRHANGLALLSDDRIDTLYDRGEQQAEFRHAERSYGMHAGISSGLHNGWVKRYSAGFGLEEHRFTPGGDATLPRSGVLPADRKFVYPFLAMEILEDDFLVASNHDQIGRVEDILQGARLNLRIGYASTSLGSLDDAILLDAGAGKGFGDTAASSLYTSADLSMRWQNARAEDLLLHTAASLYLRQSTHRLLYTSLGANIGSHLDLDNPLYLGGDNGLRGYPLRYQGGDRNVLFTIEQRYFTDWYPFRLFRIGGAVFFDAGRSWGDNPVGAANFGWLRDVGFGIRVGNNRTGVGKVIHIDLAFPLDGEDSIDAVQLLVEAKATF